MNKQLTIEKVKDLLKEKTFNKSDIARMMYPDIKSSSAAAKLKNKLDNKNGFRLVKEEQKRLIKIVSKIVCN